MPITLELRSSTDTDARIALTPQTLVPSPRSTVEVNDVITLEMIRNVEMAARGQFYIDEEGNAVYKSRFGRH